MTIPMPDKDPRKAQYEPPKGSWLDSLIRFLRRNGRRGTVKNRAIVPKDRNEKIM